MLTTKQKIDIVEYAIGKIADEIRFDKYNFGMCYHLKQGMMELTGEKVNDTRELFGHPYFPELKIEADRRNISIDDRYGYWWPKDKDGHEKRLDVLNNMLIEIEGELKVPQPRPPRKIVELSPATKMSVIEGAMERVNKLILNPPLNPANGIGLCGLLFDAIARRTEERPEDFCYEDLYTLIPELWPYRQFYERAGESYWFGFTKSDYEKRLTILQALKDEIGTILKSIPTVRKTEQMVVMKSYNMQSYNEALTDICKVIKELMDTMISRIESLKKY